MAGLRGSGGRLAWLELLQGFLEALNAVYR
jgi:hypothetical protein